MLALFFAFHWRSAIRQFGSFRLVFLILVLAVVFIPYGRTLLYSRELPSYQQFVERAGNFGVLFFKRFNFPVLWPLLVLIPTCLILLREYFINFRDQYIERPFTECVGLVLFLGSVGMVYINYLLGEVIPQPLLFHRFWFPFFMMSVFPMFRFKKFVNREKGIEQVVQFLILLLVPLYLLCAIGKGNSHFTQKDKDYHYANSAIRLTNLIISEKNIEKPLVVASQPIWNYYFASEMDVFTLIPNPILTVATHESLIRRYAQYFSFIGAQDFQEFWNFVSYVDRPGPYQRAEYTSALGGLVESMTGGLPYPISSFWLEHHSDWVRRIFENANFKDLFREFKVIIYCDRLETRPKKHFQMRYFKVDNQAGIYCGELQTII
jgi:hypothetical protein